VLGAKAMGFDMCAAVPRDGHEWYKVKIHHKEWEFQKGEVNAFNSTRKRMSIIIRTPPGLLGESSKIMLYCKGADMMMERDCNVKLPQWARLHLKSFAMEGLRTLVVAQKELSEEQYTEWLGMRKAAEADIENQDRLIDEAAALVENNMHFVGITAIEDKLQVGVPDAIANLRKAGLKIWVLTGDKEETAINIGKSCNLLDSGMDLCIVRGDNLEVDPPVPCTLTEVAKNIKGQGRGYPWRWLSTARLWMSFSASSRVSTDPVTPPALIRERSNRFRTARGNNWWSTETTVRP
jgi:magnesium-transporting ATPase (P-type)